MRRDGLQDLVNEYLTGKNNLVGLEIGSFYGDSAETFLSGGSFLKLYCIDPYEQGFDPNDKSTSDRLPDAEKVFDDKFENNNIVVKVKKRSAEAVCDFEDESLDFVYIDGNHRYEFVKADISLYFPKVKKGGIISGHDYEVSGITPHIRGVKKAVDEFFLKPPARNYSDNSWLYIKE